MSSESTTDWTTTDIGSLFALSTPGHWGDDAFDGGNVLVLRSANFRKAGGLNYETAAPRSFDAKKLSQKGLKPGDILLERSGGSPAQPVGRVNRFDNGEGYSASNFIQILRSRPGVDDWFAYYLLRDFYARGGTESLQKATTGIRNLDYATYLATPILLPPLDEQRRIAEVLRSVDEAMGNAAEVLSQTREARAHQLDSLMALPGEMRRIREICRLSGGYGFPIKFQGKREGHYPFAKVSDMNRPGNETQLKWAENHVDLEDLKLLRAKPFPVGTTFFPKVGATLLTNKRRIAACEIIVDNNVMGAVATDIDPWFLFYAFSTIDMADYVQPGAVPSVNQGTIGQIMIPVPSREIQAKYVGVMRDLDGAMEAQRVTLQKLSSTKVSLSADLLSGRVRVPV